MTQPLPADDLDALLRPQPGAPALSAEEIELLRPRPNGVLVSPRGARQRALLALNGLRAERDRATEFAADAVLSDADLADASAYEGAVREALGDAFEAYLAALPRVPVARDPAGGEVVRIAIDAEGIDGPWWNYQGVLRPVEARPSTLWAFTGALRIAGEPEFTTHLVKAGPAAPYVIPRAFEAEGMRAVVKGLMVGRHAGWVITYFTDRPPAETQRFNDWGADHYPVDGGWDAASEDDEVRDFDLAPWIERGRLAWIAPGDDSCTLRTDVQGCPYLGIEGTREVQRIHEGVLWTPSRHTSS
ncbi:MAG: hypothetical protein DWG83_00470 [Chloroflexi bacterium]|nr:hypothetical protein [Chloroflexota bacterium]MQC19033.1 hypothetical protein [Chloroflexota bacterium]